MGKTKVILKPEQVVAKKAEKAEAIKMKRELFASENETSREAAMATMNKKYVVINIGGKTTIYNTMRDDNRMMSVRDARDYFANETYQRKIVDENGDEFIKDELVFEDWFTDPNTKRFEVVIFNPDKPYGPCGLEWNTWRGWTYEPREGDCSLYLEHILQNICNSDVDLNSYLLDFMAQIIQNPTKKIFHSIAIKGEKGTGKTLFVHIFMKLFGEAAVEISDSEVLTNNFNSLLANRLLIYGDEAFWSGDRKNRGKLKNLISSNSMRITHKNKDTITMNNFLRFIFTTNEDWSAPVEQNDRRWVTLRCGNGKINDRDYFGAMINQMENGGYNALMKLLLERDISGRDWSNIPITEASKEDMAYTTVGDNVVAEYLDQCVGGMEFGSVFGDSGWRTVIPVATFIDGVREYAAKSRAYPSITPAYVASKLKDVFGREFSSKQKKMGDRNIRVYDFGPLEIVERSVNAYYKRETSVAE